MTRLVAFALLVSTSAAAETQQRTFEFTYVAALDVPEQAARVQLWVPYPRSNDYQDVRLVSIDAPVPTKLYQEYTYRNSMLFLATSGAHLRELELSVLDVTMTFRVTRREHLERDYAEVEDPEGWLEPGASRWLAPDGLVPIADEIREQAQAVTESETSVVDKAKAIFDFTVDDGGGDVLTFIGLSRAAGIPAKLHAGCALPMDGGEGELGGYHAWAEFSVPGFGWVPVDPSRASRNPVERDYFFGGIDAHRVELTMGSDIDLNPKQSGRALPLFVYPHAEIDGKPAGERDVRHQFFFKDLDLVAE